MVIAVPTGPTHTHSAYTYTQGLHIPTGPIHNHRTLHRLGGCSNCIP